jgi:HTH-type transcriptional regulator, global nitrogen regulator NrpRI
MSTLSPEPMTNPNGNLPHLDDEDEGFERPAASTPTPAALKDLIRLHGDRFLPILAALREQPWKELVSSRDIMDGLTAQGLDLSERTLRLYLAEMADSGLIDRHGRRGYRLTDTGAEIARELTVSRRLGSILSKMEETICQLSFDLNAKSGMVSINGYVIPRELVPPLCDEIEAVFKAGLSVGSHVLLVPPGDDILGREVPAGHIGIGTMCSINLASLLLRRQIPSYPIFGGLLYIENGEPQHFLEMIRYDATTLSPNEIFIRANLTSVSRAATTGTGAITASYREVPMSALPALRQLAKDCESAGFPGILLVGRPGQPLLNIPVHEGRVGVVLTTGLNPVAGLWERGLQPGAAAMRNDYSRPMVGPGPFEQLIHYSELRGEISKLHTTSRSARAGETTKP